MHKIFLKKISGYATTSLDIVRYWEWSAIVRTNLFAVLILFVLTADLYKYGTDIAVYVLYLHMVLTLGFIINNYADQSDDNRAGKNNLPHTSKKRHAVWISILLPLTIITPIYFSHWGIMAIVALGLFLGIGYSMEPLRFKERGFAGVVLPMIAQHMPFLFFYFIVPEASLFVLYLFGWLILDGILIELHQQVKDRDNDLGTGTRTYVVTREKKRVLSTLYFFTLLFILYMLVPAMTISVTGFVVTLLLVVIAHTSLRYAQLSIHVLNN